MSNEPSDTELSSLLAKLTLDEKISMLSGKNVWETTNIDRLGIPSLKVPQFASSNTSAWATLTVERSRTGQMAHAAATSLMAPQQLAFRPASHWQLHSIATYLVESASPWPRKHRRKAHMLCLALLSVVTAHHLEAGTSSPSRKIPF